MPFYTSLPFFFFWKYITKLRDNVHLRNITMWLSFIFTLPNLSGINKVLPLWLIVHPDLEALNLKLILFAGPSGLIFTPL